MPAFLLLAHGPAKRGTEELLEGLAKQVGSETGVATGFTFLEGEEKGLEGVLEGIDQKKVIILPLFVSSRSYHVSEKLFEILKAGGKDFTVARSLGDSEGLLEVVLERADSMSGEKDREALVLLVHGSKEPKRNEEVKIGFREMLDELVERSGFSEVRIAGLFHGELEGAVRELERRFSRILVVPLVIFEGRILEEKVPALLEQIDSEAEVLCDARPLFPDPRLSGWVAKELKRHLSV